MCARTTITLDHTLSTTKIDGSNYDARIKRYTHTQKKRTRARGAEFGWIYAMLTLDMVFLYVATFGGLLMGLGALIGAEYVRKSGKVMIHT